MYAAEILSESFRDSPANTTALTHNPFSLTCYAPDPSPPPSIVWLVNDVELSLNDDRRTVEYDLATGLGTLQFSEVEYSDAGLYKCQAVSEMGTVLFNSTTGTLNVQGELPHIPEDTMHSILLQQVNPLSDNH